MDRLEGTFAWIGSEELHTDVEEEGRVAMGRWQSVQAEVHARLGGLAGGGTSVGGLLCLRPLVSQTDPHLDQHEAMEMIPVP